jgi:hypothetical protein
MYKWYKIGQRYKTWSKDQSTRKQQTCQEKKGHKANKHKQRCRITAIQIITKPNTKQQKDKYKLTRQNDKYKLISSSLQLKINTRK